jgi:hypothetical protein
MRKTTLRQLEVLETEERAYQQKHQSSLGTTAFLCFKVVLAYYLGELKPDDKDPGEAEARALGYESRYDYVNALFDGEIADVDMRFKEACRRVFGQVDLDFDRSARSALSEAFVRLVTELPEQWLQWIESNSQSSRNSRVFTQIGKAALEHASTPDHLLLALIQREEAKVCFWAFRRYTRPKMKVGWFQYELANELQRFYHSWINRERPTLILMAPPQHGKTEQITDFLAWASGKQPEMRTIFASYGDDLGVAYGPSAHHE